MQPKPQIIQLKNHLMQPKSQIMQPKNHLIQQFSHIRDLLSTFFPVKATKKQQKQLFSL